MGVGVGKAQCLLLTMQALRAAKALCRSVVRSLKPVDVLVLGYLAVTAPLLFIADDVDDVAWFGAVSYTHLRAHET